MFFFKYVNNSKNYILFYKIIIFFILIKFNKFSSLALTIAKNSTYILSFSLFLSILFSYEFLNITDRINYHKFFSKIFVYYSLIHVLSHFYMIITGIFYEYKDYTFYFKPIYITGIIILVLMLIIFFMSLKIIRKNFFNIFFYIHYLVYLLIAVCILHSNYYIVFLIMLCIKPIYYYFFKTIDIKKNDVMVINNNFVFIKLFFKQKNKIKNGDCVYLTCNNISKLEKHPFTVIDSFKEREIEEENELITHFKKNSLNYITLCISNNGDWKNNFVSLINKNIIYNLNNNGLNLKIKGFYNTNILSLKKYETIHFICENIGITPFLSFLYFLSKKQNQNKIYSIFLHVQMDNLKLLNLLEYDYFKFKSIKSISLQYNIYIRNEETFNSIKNNKNFNFINTKINYNNIIKNIDNEKNNCIHYCGNSKTFFKIKYILYKSKKKYIKIFV